ncbi:MAG: hypothetical protein QNJ34_16830 [Xenococcaceae cyanobacterium MO_188.B29]|nr:hypothetical protein [Xenococcaceae cyanobacterium MO_188.B29]
MKTINWFDSKVRVNYWQQDPENNQSTVRKAIATLGKKIAQSLHNLSDRLLRFDTNSEPKIWKKKDRSGNTYFRIYDPIGDRHIYLDSEAEVRWWLDKRYYLSDS